jgi:hypothetical protein
MSLRPAAANRDSRGQPASASFFPVSVILLILSLVWCAIWFKYSWPYWEDDSFIHLEFARSLAAGHGFSFNRVVVYGDTAPLWLFLLAGIHQLIPEWLVAGKVLTLLGMLSTLTAVYVFSRRASADYAGSRNFSAVMVLLLVLNPYFCYWSFSGMETVSAAGLALWGVIAATSRPLTWSRFLLGCVLAGVAPLLRPELVFYTAIVALLLLYRRFFLLKAEAFGRKVAGFVAGLVLASGPTIAWAVYAVHTFGRVVPNTNAAKRAGPGASVTLRLANIYSLGYPVVIVGIVAAIGYVFQHRSDLRFKLDALRESPVFTAGGWVFVLWTAITASFYIVDHTYIQTRYILVSATGLSIVAMASLLAFSPKCYRIALVVCLVFAAAISTLTVWPFIHNKNLFVKAVAQQARYVREQLPPDVAVADYNIGEIAYVSERTIIDTGGITRPAAIPFLTDPDRQLEWIHSEGATYFVTEFQPEPGAVLVLSQQIPFIGWSLDPRRYALHQRLNLWKLAPSKTADSQQ